MTDPDSVNESLARYVLSGNLELNLGPYILGWVIGTSTVPARKARTAI